MAKTRDEAKKLREKVEEPDDSPPVTDDSVRSKTRTDVPIPTPPFWGVREIDGRPRRRLSLPRPPRAVQAALGRARLKGEVAEVVEGTDEEEASSRASSACGASRTTCARARRLGYFPCNADGNELIVFDPEDPERELERLVFPRQPKHDRICLADFYRPLDCGERDVVALQAVTVGPEVTELIERLETRGRVRRAALRPRARRAGGRGHWPSGCTRRSAATWGSTPTRAGATRGAIPPARTSPSTRRSCACSTPSRSACRSRTATPSTPEQSTVAIVAHHPQAVYFGMKSGFVPDEKVADELIAGTERGGELPSPA